MTESLSRRHFMGAGLAIGVASAAQSETPSANDRLTVAIVGTGSRGTSLAGEFAKRPGVIVSTVCDVDKKRTASAAKAVEKVTGKAAEPIQDFRTILDDKTVDVLVVATCNHWHAPAAILGMHAGKHVYVEKPCSHNPQRRRIDGAGGPQAQAPRADGQPAPQLAEGHRGHRAAFATASSAGRIWRRRGMRTIASDASATANPIAVPDGLDYDLWQGPAPRKPFRSNYLHYNWHWFWHWGNGELGNNGIHYARPVPLGAGRRFSDARHIRPAAATVSRTIRKRPTRMW